LLAAVSQLGSLLGLLLVVGFFWATAPPFRSFNNLSNIAQQAAVISIVAAGQTFVILTGGIDLSVGAVVGFTCSLAAGWMDPSFGFFFINQPIPSYIALPLVVVVGTLIGVIHGLLITKLNLPPFIITLGSMAIIRGLALVYTKGITIYEIPTDFRWLYEGKIGLVPVPILVMLAIYAICWLVLTQTRFGRHLYAIGGNPIAARLSGINVDVELIRAYAICSFLSAVAGVVLLARLGAGIYNSGETYELQAIAAVVIGGTSLIGGTGSVIGSLIGALILGVVPTGLVQVGADPRWNNVVLGSIIVLAVLVDVLRKRLRLTNA
jgi:ribose/xylose/arabinose/galactoside ABC-type transport system permease subunit